MGGSKMSYVGERNRDLMGSIIRISAALKYCDL